jgi:Mrp family chromosome partitioning ATPase
MSRRALVEVESAVVAAVKGVRDPVIGRTLGELGFVRGALVQGVEGRGPRVEVDVGVPTLAHPERGELRDRVEAAARSAAQEASEVRVRVSALEPRPYAAGVGLSRAVAGLERVAHVVAVSSCKGGVGKSTVAVNLACALAASGGRVGLLDADLHGPSLPFLVSPEDTRVVRGENGRLKPVLYDAGGLLRGGGGVEEAGGVDCALRLMSYGYVSPRNARGERSGAAMRGPMQSSIVTQLAQLTDWGALDVLVVDMPPGTGDIALTLGQKLSLSGAVVVTTPHRLAIADVVKGIDMFAELRVPIWSLVENMAYFDGDDGKRYFPFGASQVQALAQHHAIPHTLSLPLAADVAANESVQPPVAIARPQSAAAESVAAAFRDLAATVVRQTLRAQFAAADAESFSARWLPAKRRILLRRIRKDGAEQIELDPLTVRRASRAANAGDPAAVPADVVPLRIDPQGNYGVRVAWSDGHDAAIYPYTDLWALRDGPEDRAEDRA